MHHLCKLLHVTRDDPKITEMTPYDQLWYFYNWIEDKEEEVTIVKQHALLLASFDHPEEVRKMTDDSSKYTSTESEFDESTRMVKEINAKLEQPRKRKRVILKE